MLEETSPSATVYVETNESQNNATTPIETNKNDIPLITNNVNASGTKEKRCWFHSFTRRKSSTTTKTTTTTTAAAAAISETHEAITTPNNEIHLRNNNNEEPNSNVSNELLGAERNAVDGTTQATANTATATSAAAATILSANATPDNVIRKRKDEKNILERFKKKISMKFPSLRHRRLCTDDACGAGGTTDASAEFLTRSPIRETSQNMIFPYSRNINALDEPEEMVPFTHDYNRFIIKKWLEGKTGPNRIMYKACSEMLSQVWYWGEISRRDAQKQLTDKPTGSFLVRDSESSGCQFTLSFRIVNVTLHYRLEYRDNYWHFEELQYESIVEMIEDILYRCTNDNFVCFVKVPNKMQPPFPVILKYPLSRYLKIPHLQDLCRRVIQKHTSLEEIAALPIPPKLQEYLTERRELVF